jgi:hypothetical protein
MHTLREVVDHTGVAGTAGQVVGASIRPVSLRASGDLVAAVLPPAQRLSLLALCAALPTLPPVTLDARITDHGDDVTPGQPVIAVSPPTGAVVETVVTFFEGGVIDAFASSGRLVDGQEIVGATFSSTAFSDPGLYEAVVRRVGVTGTGVVDLQRRLPFRVRAAPIPTPPSPPTPRPPVGPTCGVELDSRNGGTSNVRVFGGGFPAGNALVVLEDDAVATTTVTDGLGSYRVIIGVLETTPPVTHRFQAVNGTGARSNEAGFTV